MKDNIAELSEIPDDHHKILTGYAERYGLDIAVITHIDREPGDQSDSYIMHPEDDDDFIVRIMTSGPFAGFHNIVGDHPKSSGRE